VFEAPQHGGAFDLQVLVAAESDHVADGVVKLDGGHAAPDHSARVRAGLNTCEHEAIQSAGSGAGCEERLRNRCHYFFEKRTRTNERAATEAYI